MKVKHEKVERGQISTETLARERSEHRMISACIYQHMPQGGKSGLLGLLGTSRYFSVLLYFLVLLGTSRYFCTSWYFSVLLGTSVLLKSRSSLFPPVKWRLSEHINRDTAQCEECEECENTGWRIVMDKKPSLSPIRTSFLIWTNLSRILTFDFNEPFALLMGEIALSLSIKGVSKTSNNSWSLSFIDLSSHSVLEKLLLIILFTRVFAIHTRAWRSWSLCSLYVSLLVPLFINARLVRRLFSLSFSAALPVLLLPPFCWRWCWSLYSCWRMTWHFLATTQVTVLVDGWN